MLTIKTMPVLLKIVGKLDIKPIIPMLKDLDIFEETDSKDGALAQLSKEKIGVLAFEIIGELTPQLGKIADDLPQLVATYKGVSLEEAEKLDAAEIINEIINDKGIRSFFQTALRKKAEQGA